MRTPLTSKCGQFLLNCCTVSRLMLKGLVIVLQGYSLLPLIASLWETQPWSRGGGSEQIIPLLTRKTHNRQIAQPSFISRCANTLWKSQPYKTKGYYAILFFPTHPDSNLFPFLWIKSSKSSWLFWSFLCNNKSSLWLLVVKQAMFSTGNVQPQWSKLTSRRAHPLLSRLTEAWLIDSGAPFFHFSSLCSHSSSLMPEQESPFNFNLFIYSLFWLFHVMWDLGF